MKEWQKLLLGGTGIAVGVGLSWRFLSRRRSLPCPSWLEWLLENPYMEMVAGSQTLLERLDLEPGMSVLDVGCGPGRLAIPAAQRVGPAGNLVALDVQEEMLRRLQTRMQRAPLDNIQLVHAGIGKNVLARNEFDRAILVTVLGEIPAREEALAEIYGALKPGGLLSITEVIPDPHYQSRRTVRRLAKEAGFWEKQSFGNWIAFTLNFVKPSPG
jgi:ubiquinone/menaquinone biosynthesis C-methylase UbiE